MILNAQGKPARQLSRRRWFNAVGKLLLGQAALGLHAQLIINPYRYAAPAGCGNSLQQTIEPGTDAFVATGTDFTKMATKFTASFTGTVCRIDARIRKEGAPSGTMKASIWTNSSNLPGAIIGTASGDYNQTDPTTSFAYFTFENISGAVTSSTIYFAVIEFSALTDTSNEIHWQYGSPSVGNNLALYSGSWNNFGFTSHQFETKLYT